MTIRLSSKFIATLIASVALLAGLAGAQPEPWVHPDGSIHYYDAISTPAGINWNFAWDSALGHGGYLATITTQAENDFVFSLVDSSLYWYQRPGTGRLAGPWIGGTQDFGSPEPDSGWHWVTNESMNYLNWSSGQPDNQGNENALHFGESTGVRVPTWDDASSLDDSIRGFVRELSADSTTVGLRYWDSLAWEGYTLFANNGGRAFYLIDNKGRAIHRWRVSDKTVGALYLLENGLVSQIGNLNNPNFLNGGRVSLIDWDGNKTWSFDYSDSTHCQHHDAIWLPNGHMMAIAWERKTKAEARAAGRDTAKLTAGKLWPDHIIEVDTATDSIVWEWHIWDHLVQDYDSTKANYGVVGDHRELIDLNFTDQGSPSAADWIHANALDYDSVFDQILFSARDFDEVWVIDHSTTTEEAREHTGGRQGMGGDLLYRWGNPRTYRAGDSTDQQFYHQHHTSWIKPGLSGTGNITVFDNGLLRPGTLYSTAIEFTPPVDSTGHYETPEPGQPYGPADHVWQYIATPPSSFYSSQLGSVQRLPNGNTLICEGNKGRFFELGPDSVTVWKYTNPVSDTLPAYQGTVAQNAVHRSPRYAPDYAGLQGHDLTPGYPVELYQTRQYVGVKQSPPAGSVPVGLAVRPNPFGRRASISFNLPRAVAAELGIYSVDGRLVRTLPATSGTVWNGADNNGYLVGRGVYYCRLQGPTFSTSAKLVKTE
ncbi:MAG: aryl-sulfate sulfotransferase [candidate division WOR-3 bacterium]|nr:aryl-sulfate sulfotransferase [candidate division WOR-3 bacterium]